MNIKLLGRLEVIVGMIELWNGLKENIHFEGNFFFQILDDCQNL